MSSLQGALLGDIASSSNQQGHHFASVPVSSE